MADETEIIEAERNILPPDEYSTLDYDVQPCLYPFRASLNGFERVLTP